MTTKNSVTVLVALGVLSLPFWPLTPDAANRRLDDALDDLEKRVARVEERGRANEAKIVNNEAVVDEVVRKLSRLEPKESIWLDLEMGRGHKWLFDSGEQATMEFVGLTEDQTTPTFRVVHKTLDTVVALRAGESIRGVDDRGTERRVYTSTLHAMHRDRTGAPKRGLVSVSYSVESGL